MVRWVAREAQVRRDVLRARRRHLCGRSVSPKILPVPANILYLSLNKLKRFVDWIIVLKSILNNV